MFHIQYCMNIQRVFSPSLSALFLPLLFLHYHCYYHYYLLTIIVTVVVVFVLVAQLAVCWTLVCLVLDYIHPTPPRSSNAPIIIFQIIISTEVFFSQFALSLQDTVPFTYFSPIDSLPPPPFFPRTSGSRINKEKHACELGATVSEIENSRIEIVYYFNFFYFKFSQHLLFFHLEGPLTISKRV